MLYRTSWRRLVCGCLAAWLLAACSPTAAAPTATRAVASPTASTGANTATTPRAAPTTPTTTVAPTLTVADRGLATATRAATAGTSAYPAGCTPAEVEAFLGQFFDAFNRGDQVALRAFFPTIASGQAIGDITGTKFLWYSVMDQRLDGSRRHFVAYDLPALWTYFAERYARHETLRLARVLVSGEDAMTATLTVYLYRAADDVPPESGYPPGQADGLALLNCRDRTILGWSIGQGRFYTATPTR